MDLEELKVYNMAMEIGETVWSLVSEWNIFAKDTVGKQFVRAADSIAANLSEGFGRYHYKESMNYGYYSRGSLFETKTWLTKAHNRKLIKDDAFNSIAKELNIIGKMLNKYIKSIGSSSIKISDTIESYSANDQWLMTNDQLTNDQLTND